MVSTEPKPQPIDCNRYPPHQRQKQTQQPYDENKLSNPTTKTNYSTTYTTDPHTLSRHVTTMTDTGQLQTSLVPSSQ
jgi:hypothetical protein